ncbi:MAG: M13 family metallopeptidase [Lachnospiraceae bacterium]|nr:M13 family metallopeptidase [Lachnospiraceae bacterium]
MRLFDAMDTVKERCMELLSDKELLNSEDPQVVHDASLIQGVYELFLDWDKRNELGVTPFEPMVAKLLSIGTLEELTEYLLSEDNYYWGAFPAFVYLGKDAADSSLYNVEISSTPLLTYGDAAEYEEETQNGRRSREYVDALFTYMAGRFGIGEKEAEKYLKDAFSFEKQIASAEKTVLEQHDPAALKESINPVTMEDIREVSSNFPLAEYMERYGYAESKLINLNEPKWLPALNNLYTEEHLEELKAYILKGTLTGLSAYTDEEAYRKQDELANKASGIEESAPDEEVAYNLVKSIFPDSFSRLYIDLYLSPEIKEEITKLCEDAVDTYREMLSETEWLSEETRKKAINKLDHLTIHAVYPEKWEDDSMYEITGKADGGTYLKAIEDISRSSVEQMRLKINGTVDKEIWEINILDTNAYYNPTNNSVNIIPGFFCDVTYRSDMSTEEKYGALGSVIGHEISHAFDTNGAQYDENGNVSDWWTKEDYDAFMERAGKLVDYYDQVVAFDDGTPYSGQMVQTEAIADMAGLKCMLKMAEKIEGFDYDKFFQANARLWSRVDTMETAEAIAMSDSHPLHYLRANVTAQQFEELIETYDLQPGDGMYLAPEDRIAVW